jgi:TolB-like protein/DNA-binding winged helix-turn-helix (wHTH) protein
MSNAVQFGPFKLDLKAGELHKHGRKIRLQEQPLQLLRTLVERPGEVVTREELRNRLWPNGTTVEFGHSINSAIKRLRDVLGDTADKPKYVETVARRGYRFLLSVQWEEVSPPQPAASVAPQATESAVLSTAEPVEASIPLPPPGLRLKQRRRPLLLVFALGALVLGLVAGLQSFDWFGRSARNRITSLAVLPLEDLSGDKGQGYFADGMTDELISDLGKISALRVISRTSVMRYRGMRKPVQEIARDLHVDAVVEGTVLRSGNRVRITAHLIRAVPETHLWTENYERDLRDVMVLQDDVARQIANEVQVKLTPQEHARLASAHPVRPAAYEAYLKGRYLLNKRTEEGMQRSIEYFRQAINTDSRYALAYAGLADAYTTVGGFGLLRPKQAYPKAEEAANKALEIDSTLAEAHTALGFSYTCYERDWRAAEREFRRAIELNPNYATAHFRYAEHLANIGQAECAIAELKCARELDPLSLAINATLGRAYRDSHRFDEAVEQCRKTLELEPNFAQAHWCLGLGYLGKQRYGDAIMEFQRTKVLGHVVLALWSIGYTYAITGRKAEARAILGELKQQSREGFVSPYYTAGIYAGLGEKDHAFEWLYRAYEEGEWLSLKLDPFLDNLRSDPRFQELLRRLNLPS